MKTLIALGVGAALALAACGAAAPAPATAAPATAEPATAATAAPAATAAQTAAAATAAPAAGPARKVAFEATNDTYGIQALEVKLGERIEFEIKNTGEEKHNLVGVGEGISLASPDIEGEATLNWTWVAPLKAGQFKLVCAYHPNIAPILVTVK